MTIDTGKITTAVIIFIVTGAMSTGTVAVLKTNTHDQKIENLNEKVQEFKAAIRDIRKDQKQNQKLLIRIALKMKAVKREEEIALGAEKEENTQ